MSDKHYQEMREKERSHKEYMRLKSIEEKTQQRTKKLRQATGNGDDDGVESVVKDDGVIEENTQQPNKKLKLNPVETTTTTQQVHTYIHI